MPVLRPLVGMDKEEITVQAERLGTYPISIVPDEDCCTLFTPRHPLTRARSSHVAKAEQSLPLDRMVEAALAEAVIERYRYPEVEVQSSPQTAREVEL